jgi:hypothetical protein
MSFQTRSLRRLLRPVKNLVRPVSSRLWWLWNRFPRDPSVELYSRRKDKINAEFFKLVQHQKADGLEAWLEPYYARTVPRIIWMFWSQGEANFPPIVAGCVQRWRDLHPDWTVNVLDKAQAEALIDMSDVPDDFPLRIYADALRVRLLRSFGGVWADTTLYPHKPLDSWLPFLASSGFFVFTYDGPGRDVENWFIAAEQGNVLVSAWDRTITRHLSRTRIAHEAYFHVYYVLQHAIERDATLNAAWNIMAHVPAPPCFLFSSFLQGYSPETAVLNALASGQPLSKLDWRMPVEWDHIDAAAIRLTSGVSVQ